MEYFYSIEPQRTTLEECIEVVERILQKSQSGKVDATILANSTEVGQLVTLYDALPRGTVNHIHWLHDVKSPAPELHRHHVESFCRIFERASGSSRLSFTTVFAPPTNNPDGVPNLRRLSLERFLEGEVYVSIAAHQDPEGRTLRPVLAAVGIGVPDGFAEIRAHHRWAWRIVVDPVGVSARLRTNGLMDPGMLDIIPNKPQEAIPIFRSLLEKFPGTLDWYRVQLILEPDDLRPFAESLGLPVETAHLSMDSIALPIDASVIRRLRASGLKWLVSWSITDASGFPGLIEVSLVSRANKHEVKLSSYDLASPADAVRRIEQEWGLRAEYQGSYDQ